MDRAAFTLRAQPVVIPGSGLPAPVVTYLVSDGLWRLEADYRCRVNCWEIRVPEGFRFDLASVPRPLWWVIAPFELSIAAPLVHDFLYRHRGAPPPGAVRPPAVFDRRQADRLFAEIMRREGVAGWRRCPAYHAVRWFGGFSWGRSAAVGR